MTANSLKDLVAVLADKTLLLESVRDRLEEEQRCIIAVQPELLDEKTRSAEECISRLNMVNIRFKTLLAKSGEELGLAEAESLSSIISLVEPEMALELRELQERCFSAAGAIGGIISMNQVLIKNSLNIINRSLSLFSNILGGSETYGAAGRMANGKAVAGILCREI